MPTASAAFYLGANFARTQDPGAGFDRRQTEIFVKGSWAFELL